MKELRTERLLLRELVESDAPVIAKYMDDPEIASFVANVPYPYSLDDAKNFIRKVQEKAEKHEAYEWGIELEGEIIGAVNIHEISVKHRRAMIGYLLSKEHHRKGIMSEAVRAVIEHAFSELNIERLGAEVYVGNDPSFLLLEKLGFQKEGLLRRHTHHRGMVHDVYVYSLLRVP